MGAFSAFISIAFHGLAYAMVLYLVAVGLSVTMGLMGFVNLAHGVFAAAGGYVMTRLMNAYGVPFPVAVAAAFCAGVWIGGDFGGNGWRAAWAPAIGDCGVI